MSEHPIDGAARLTISDPFGNVPQGYWRIHGRDETPNAWRRFWVWALLGWKWVPKA